MILLWCRGRESNPVNNAEQIGTNNNIPKVFSVLTFAQSARSARAAGQFGIFHRAEIDGALRISGNSGNINLAQSGSDSISSGVRPLFFRYSYRSDVSGSTFVARRAGM
jgi:hypothetical protein